jgi:hypothetical protein
VTDYEEAIGAFYSYYILCKLCIGGLRSFAGEATGSKGGSEARTCSCSSA